MLRRHRLQARLRLEPGRLWGPQGVGSRASARPAEVIQSGRGWRGWCGAALVVAWVALSGAVAIAQGQGAGDGLAAEVDVQAEMAAESAKLAQMATDIEESLGIYIIHKDDREALEGVIVKGSRAEVWFLRPLERNIDDAKCDAFRWLFNGRLAATPGVLPLFKRYPELDEVTLVFYAVRTKVRSDNKGGYIQDRTPIRHLELSLTRERALALDPKRTREILKRSRGTCIEEGQKLVDRYWSIN